MPFSQKERTNEVSERRNDVHHFVKHLRCQSAMAAAFLALPLEITDRVLAKLGPYAVFIFYFSRSVL